MSDIPLQTQPEAKKSIKGVVILTVLATLVAVFIFEKLLVLSPKSEYQARAKRSEALLAAQEQRSKAYQEYYAGVQEDHKRFQKLLSQQEQDSPRFQKILDTWERQQREYQTYLDSLKRPQ